MKKQLFTSAAFSVAAILTMLQGGFNSARADQEVQLHFNMPVHVNALVSETGCDNSPGPQITVEGEILLGGLECELTFKNNVKGTHTDVVTFDTTVTLVPVGGKIVIPKQPVLGGVGGNPHIWMQFYNDGGNLTDPIYLGRCVQGLRVPGDFVTEVAGLVDIAADGCENNPGPYITFGGELSLAGMKARLIFSNNLKGTHTADTTSVNVVIIPAGLPVQIPKQPVLGGVGGNPLIWVDFLEGDGDPIGDPIFLGRCVQL